MRGFDIAARRPFIETLVQLIIGMLFISISATVTPASLRNLILPTLGLVAVLVLLARPLADIPTCQGRDQLGRLAAWTPVTVSKWLDRTPSAAS